MSYNGRFRWAWVDLPDVRCSQSGDVVTMMISVDTEDKTVSIWEKGDRICVFDINENKPVRLYRTDRKGSDEVGVVELD